MTSRALMEQTGSHHTRWNGVVAFHHLARNVGSFEKRDEVDGLCLSITSSKVRVPSRLREGWHLKGHHHSSRRHEHRRRQVEEGKASTASTRMALHCSRKTPTGRTQRNVEGRVAAGRVGRRRRKEYVEGTSKDGGGPSEESRSSP